MKTRDAFSVCAALALTACAQPSFRAEIPREGKPPLVVTQSGDAAVGVSVKVKREEKSPFSWFSDSARTPIQKADFSPFQREGSFAESVPTTSEVVEIAGPRAFSPPAPPSAPEKALAGVIVALGLAGVGCALGAAAAFYFGHVKAGWVLVATGAGMGLAAKFLSVQWAFAVLVVGAVIAATLWAAWHFVKDRVPVEHGGRLSISRRGGGIGKG